MFPKQLIFLFILILVGFTMINSEKFKDDNYIHGTVVEISDDHTEETSMQRIQKIKIRIDEKGYDNKIISVNHVISPEYTNPIVLKLNSRRSLFYEYSGHRG
ncbi:hypothetical protein [Anaerosacchariphilus polymeriproducens]|uniref:Uncharacterized protein n=1 Tax=Anaerosacchariphilus polymeriproducens TaxID=1812858 RepID=A0A371AYR4_9FIRM|nr:hypothetical protein [Anaerosacchariphilus polymeriproducens]RDU24701.1 hypothetical protein DWV06_04325 [Anaerosacchariphilus polymeriproducens]